MESENSTKELAYRIETDPEIENKLTVTTGEGGEGIIWEYGINRMHTPIYVKQKNNKHLLYSEGTQTQYLVINYHAKESKKRICVYIYMCVWHNIVNQL